MDLRSKRMIQISHIILLVAMLVLFTRVGGIGMISVAGSVEIFCVICMFFLGGVADAMEYMARVRSRKDREKDASNALKAGAFYSLIAVILAELALWAANRFLIEPSGLMYVGKLLQISMIGVPFLGVYQVLRGIMQAHFERWIADLSRLIFVVSMIIGTVIAVLLLGDYGAKAGMLMQSAMLEQFYVVLALVPGVITGALVGSIYLTVMGFLYRDRLYLLDNPEGASEESVMGLVFPLFKAHFSEVIAPCLRRLPIIVLLWLSLGEILAESYLFGNFYGGLLPVLSLAWTVYDMSIFGCEKKLVLAYRNKQGEQYYRDLKTVLCYVLLHSAMLAGFVLALHKSYLAIWYLQTSEAFMELATAGAVIAFLGLPCRVLTEVLRGRNMHPQAIVAQVIGCAAGIIFAVVGYKSLGAGCTLYVAAVAIQMLVTILVAGFSLSSNVGINYISVFMRTWQCLVFEGVLAVLLFGMQRLLFTALGGFATLMVCVILGVVIQYFAILAFHIFDRDELGQLPLAPVSRVLSRFF